MESWSLRQQRWLAIGVSSLLLAMGAAGAANGADVVVLGVVVGVPFLAAALSGRTIRQTLAVGLLTLFGIAYAFYSFSEAQLLALVWLAGVLVLRWDDSAQVVARFVAGLIVALGVWAYSPDVSEPAWLLAGAAVTLLAVGVADEIAGHVWDGQELVVPAAPDFDALSNYSLAQKLAVVAWSCLLLAPVTWYLGLPLVVLLIPVAFGAGLAGAVAAFTAEPAEGEVRALTFAVAMTPVLIIFGAAVWLVWLLSQIEWTVM